MTEATSSTDALTCEDCAHFDVTHNAADDESVVVAGYCRRYAPVPPGITQMLAYVEPDKPRRAMWPIVTVHDWCGEHSELA